MESEIPENSLMVEPIFLISPILVSPYLLNERIEKPCRCPQYQGKRRGVRPMKDNHLKLRSPSRR
jgi:hypothetical protein